ncbi:MAG TPA: hypothetical protein DCF47_02685, partial [Kandleria vitulina]|nr:hypothetical protein [Kandleria vitulina]
MEDGMMKKLFACFLCLLLVACGKDHAPLVEKTDNLESITVLFSDKSNVYKDKNDMSSIINYLKKAQWTAESKNDTPDKKEYGTITLKYKSEETKIYFYSEDNKQYFESP